MTEISSDPLDPNSNEGMNAVSDLTRQISEKLKLVGFIRNGMDDDISHHLAEVAYMGSFFSSSTLPGFLRSEGEALGDRAVDIVEYLREMKESIEAMEGQLIRMMNHVTVNRG